MTQPKKRKGETYLDHNGKKKYVYPKKKRWVLGEGNVNFSKYNRSISLFKFPGHVLLKSSPYFSTSKKYRLILEEI